MKLQSSAKAPAHSFDGVTDAALLRIDGCTCFRMRRMTRLVTQHNDRVLAPSGLRVTQFSLLSHLAGAPPVPIGTLADAMDMDRTSLSRTLKPLIDAGWVRLSADGDDARRRCVSLTPAGLAKRNDAKKLWRAAQNEVNARLGIPRVAALHDLFDELTARFRDGANPPSPVRQLARR